MHHQKSVLIPSFQDARTSAAYSPARLAARAIFLRDVAMAWQKAGDNSTAEKIQRDAENHAKRFGPLGRL